MACWTRLYHSLVDLGEKDALSQRSQKKVMYMYTDELKQQLFSSPEPKGSPDGLIVYPCSAVIPLSVLSLLFVDKFKHIQNHLDNQSQILRGASMGMVNKRLSHKPNGHYIHM